MTAGQEQPLQSAQLAPSQRILIVGLSGSGKSTLATSIAELLGLPHVELDALHWQPDWVQADTEVFRSRVDEATQGDRWVVCGNYWNKLGSLLWLRADTVVWLDLPLWLVEVRSVRRTLKRAVTRVELWSGNREKFRHLWAKDALWRYNLQNRRRLRTRYAQAITDPQWSHITFHRLRTRRQVHDWTAALTNAATPRSAGGDPASRRGIRRLPSIER